jgi:hypothetical protein
MIRKYFADCPKGHPIQVELFQAGSTVNCPTCQSETSVPDTLTLKKNSGDKYPLLAPIDKIRSQIAAKERPFDGVCVACGRADTEIVVPIRYRSLTERQLDHDGGIRIGLSGIQLSASGGVETWDDFIIPLHLCHSCFESFESKRRFHKWKNRTFSATMLIVLLVFLILAYYQMELVAAVSGILWLVGLAAWAAGMKPRKTVDPSLKIAMEKIEWLEAVAESMEMQLSVGPPIAADPEDKFLTPKEV